jgi:hypothetical protein
MRATSPVSFGDFSDEVPWFAKPVEDVLAEPRRAPNPRALEGGLARGRKGEAHEGAG